MHLQLAKHRAEFVLMSSRKVLETIKIEEQKIMSYPFIRYLEVMIDARVNFKHQDKHVSSIIDDERRRPKTEQEDVAVYSFYISAHIRNILSVST